MPQRILGLDIGTWSAKAVVLESQFRGFKVVDALEVLLPPPESEEDTLKDRQARAVTQLLEQESSKVDVFVAALPGERVTTRFVTLPYSDPRKVEQTIGGELADVLPFDIEDTVFDHEVVGSTDDGGSVSLAVVAQQDELQGALEFLETEDIDPKFLSADVVQLFNLYTHFLKSDASRPEEPSRPAQEASTFVGEVPEGPPPGRLILDIGHERTLIALATVTGLSHVRVLRTGGSTITKAISQAFELPLQEAEELKHAEGFVASARQPAPSEAAQKMSDAVAAGLAPLMRDLRRTLLTIRSERRARVSRIDLLGGGSKLRNLAQYVADELNVPAAPGLAVEQIVERGVDDAARRPAYALALALCLRAAGDERVCPIDLRKEQFAFAGQLQHLRRRIPFMAASAGVLLFLLGINVWASYQTVIAKERAIDRKFCEITKEAIGREICEPKQATSVMAQPASELGNVQLPERSALNIVAELSDRIPEAIAKDTHIDEVDITPDRARIVGETSTFDAVDQLVAEYSKEQCYKNIKKGKLVRKSDGSGIEFQISIRLECS